MHCSVLRCLARRGGGGLVQRGLRRCSVVAGQQQSEQEAQRFQVWAALEAREEARNISMARLLSTLHDLAEERNSVSLPVDAASTAWSIAVPPPRHNALPRALVESGISRGGARDAVSQILSEDGASRFPAERLAYLLEAGAELLASEPSVLDLRDRPSCHTVTVIGDLHGDVQSLARVLEAVGELGGSKSVVFNGDFVDRGSGSTEVLAALLLLKLAHPENVFLLRGNHEDAMLAQAYGFYDELRHKFKDDAAWLWPGAYRVFASLPLAARTHEAFVVHGGLPTAQLDLDELAAMPPERRMYPSVLPSHSADESQAEERDFSDQEDADDIWLMQGLLWSDPSDEECGVTPNLARGDAGVVFGVDVSSQWLKKYGLKYLVRSHEVALSGCNVIECGAGDDGVERFVYTVFSAADYPDGQGYNKGAVLTLDNAPAAEGPDGRAAPRPSHYSRDDESEAGATAASAAVARAEGKAERTLAALIFSHQHRLREAFESVAPHGRVSIEAWAGILASELELPALDFRALQPQLADTIKRAAARGEGGAVEVTCSGLIDWGRFLQRFSQEFSAAPSAGKPLADAAASSGPVSTGHANVDRLRTIFAFLDVNGDGTICRDEWARGVSLLNERLPPRERLADADALFDELAPPGHAELALDDFSAALTKLKLA